MDKNSLSYTARFQAWLAHPITVPMDFPSVVLTVGLIMILAYAWSRILSHITE